MKKYLLLDSGYYWLYVIELTSDEEIELTTELLEQATAECIKNGIGINFIKDDDENIKEMMKDDEIEGYVYLDLSCYDMNYNVYLDIRNCKLLDEIPETYTINLKVSI